MKRTIHKIFLLWQFDKEEKWINEMSAKGLQLTDVGPFRYVFEEGLPREYIYRLELLDELPTHPKSMEYIHFIEETGAEHIASLIRWVYFRKKNTEQGFDLFSDIDSRIKHLDRMLCLAGVLAIAGFLISLNSLHSLISLPLPTFKNFSFLPHTLSVLNLLIWSIFDISFISIYLKRRKLKKEKLLHE